MYVTVEKNMKLLIVESPSKAKTIGKYVGDDFVVKASVGHVRDLPKSNKNAIDIEGGFIPHYEISPDKKEVVRELQNLAADADEVILATDPDREGEAIAWHIKEAIGLKKPKRIVFHEVTKEAILEALKHPREIDEKLKEAQEARRVLDRLVGYDLSGVIWKKVRYGLSAGRVQSPALRILMEREREIRAFVPEQYFIIGADFKTKKGDTFHAEVEEEVKDAKVAENIETKAKGADWIIDSVKETEAKRAAKPPFITSTLQQVASTRLGYSPSRTMQLAQKLYEAGHITYMRTDSTNLSKEAVANIHSLIVKEYGKEFVSANVFKTKSKNAQEAHEAIRPSHIEKSKAGATPEQQRLYSLIRARTIASQMQSATIMRTKIIVSAGSDIPTMASNGSRIIYEGWLLADPDAKGEDVILPSVTEKDPVKLLSIATEAKETTPPSRYSEAGLVKELEKRGIGRPSTYASIIKTIIDRQYVEKEGKTLKPTDTGDVVSSFLEEHFASYISDTFTADMEDQLDDVAVGKRTYEKTLTDFYKGFHKDVKAKDKIAKATTLGKAEASIKCPDCGAGMDIKLGRGGKFLSCEKYPECEGARTIDGGIMEKPKDTGRKCPKCEEGMLMERQGKFGGFIACSRYPKCKYIEQDEKAEAAKNTGVKCPDCNVGDIRERRGRFGLFYSCSNYPTCKFAMKSKPTGNVCNLCGKLMMQGTKTIPERCSDKSCPNHNPHKLQK